MQPTDPSFVSPGNKKLGNQRLAEAAWRLCRRLSLPLEPLREQGTAREPAKPTSRSYRLKTGAMHEHMFVNVMESCMFS